MSVSETGEAVIERPKVRILPDGQLSAADAATYLGLDGRTLANRRIQGLNPSFVKVSNRVFYYQHVLDSFIQGKAA